MDGTKPFPFTTKPGVKRDGTVLDGDYHTDCQHTGWREGRARKMGGYRIVSASFVGPLRSVLTAAQAGLVTVHAACATALQVITLTPDGFGGGISDRTPTATTGTYTGSTANLWGMVAQYSASTATTAPTGGLIIAHPGQNLTDISNDTTTNVFLGNMASTGALTYATGIPAISGGVCVLSPYLFIYGSNGYVGWSVVNDPNNFTATAGSGDARIDSTKVVFGAPVRGGGQSPAGLFWTLKKLVRATFVGTSAGTFRFDDISAQTSILSSRCCIEYDGVWYWIGLDRFLIYNGVVQELPNNQNFDWFFDNLNRNQRQKVWATKVESRSEVWWYFPFGNDATECNAAIIYNIQEKTWYDTRQARAGGYFTQDFLYPLWADTVPQTATNESTYALWAHEFGFDEVRGSQALAIPAWVEKADITFAANGPMGDQWTGEDRNVRFNRLEPDFVQSGVMTMTVIGRAFARSDEVETDFQFLATTEKIDPKLQYRQLRVRFTSNTLGGNFREGMNLIHLGPGDARP